MFIKSIVAGIAGSALLATVAFAQTPTDKNDKAEMSTTTSASSTSYQGNWRASKVVGLNVYNDNNQSVGSINDLLMDKSGDIKAVVIGVGGFLGVGEHLVAVPLDKVKFVNQPVAYTGASASNTTPTTTTGAATTAPAATTTAPAATTTAPAATTTAPAAMPKSNPWYPDHAVFNATKDELKAMAEFKYTTE